MRTQHTPSTSTDDVDPIDRRELEYILDEDIETEIIDVFGE